MHVSSLRETTSHTGPHVNTYIPGDTLVYSSTKRTILSTRDEIGASRACIPISDDDYLLWNESTEGGNLGPGYDFCRSVYTQGSNTSGFVIQDES